MYLPSMFEQDNPERLHELMRQYPFATWITLSQGGLLINHIPFVLDTSRGEQGVLMGHVARANPVWREFSPTLSSVVVFQGPQAYVTPSWYAGKEAHGKVVPTWNYAVVHVQGIPRVVEDRTAFLALLERLTAANEAAFTTPWKITDAPADYIDKTMNAIVGIEIPIQRIEGKWKMSQNRDNADREGVIAGLQAQGTEQSLATADWVASLSQEIK